MMSDRELCESYLLTVYMPCVGRGTRAYDYAYRVDGDRVRIVCLANGDVRYTTVVALNKWLAQFDEYRTLEPLGWTAEDERGRGVIK